ncbi:MAG: hypothetical protein NVSMB23_20540 [Myxococcales bacterium]
MAVEDAAWGLLRGALSAPFTCARGRAAAVLAAVLAAVSAAACGDGATPPPCIGIDCSVQPSSSACQRDSDCGDGICGANGICRDRYSPGTQATACANVTCPAGSFCANGACLPATAQCKAPDPACIFIPQGSFEPPVHQWWWPWQTPEGPDDTTGRAALRTDLLYPDYAQVMSTPVVLRLRPRDVSPAVVFNALPSTFNPGFVENQGVMRAISGVDGSPLWTAPLDFLNNQDKSVNANSNVAAGDCMGTGEACFIAGGWDPLDAPPRTTPAKAHQHGGLVAFGSDGRFLWVNRDMQVWWGGAAIARLLGPTGPAQVVVGNGVVDGATGKTLCYQTTQTASGDQVGGNGDGTLTAIADIDLDGIPEIITANDAFKLVVDGKSPTGYSCPSVFPHPVEVKGAPCPGGFGNVCGSGFPAVANFAGYGASIGLSPTDPHPQIVVVSHGFLRIHDWTGGMLLNPVPLPEDKTCTDANQGGAPTIADFDGDGLPEIGIAGQGAYVLFKPAKGFIWSSPTRDCSSNTGSSVFDFEGKGQAKVVYGDQCFTRIYDGKTGTTLIEEKNSSCTAYEMPIVADIDGSGRSKILVPANKACGYICPWGKQDQFNIIGLKALGSPSDKWVNTRSVWNQHTYHVTNVNIDGTLPYPETNSWAPGASNSYRQNVQGQGVFSAPDLVACQVSVDLTSCMAGSAVVWVTVYNGGALVVKPGVSVTAYADEAAGSFRIGTGATTRALQPGDTEKVPVRWNNPPLGQSMNLRAVIDEKQLIGDCHPENNTAVIGPIKCTPLG